MAGLSRDGNTTRFGWVLELAMATLGLDPDPAISLESPQDFADFHG